MPVPSVESCGCVDHIQFGNSATPEIALDPVPASFVAGGLHTRRLGSAYLVLDLS